MQEYGQFYIPAQKWELVELLRGIFPNERKSFFMAKNKKQLYAIYYKQRRKKI
jgi:hypothetical protein